MEGSGFIGSPTGVQAGGRWYAAYVRANHEFRVSERLAKAGIEAFLPAVERSRRWKDRRKSVSFPLFPSYLFVHTGISPKERLAILKTPGIVSLLGTAGEAEPVSDGEIDSLKRLVSSRVPIEPYPYLKEGRRVRVKRGALEGIEGVLVEIRGGHSLVLSVDILRRGVSVRVDASDIEPA